MDPVWCVHSQGVTMPNCRSWASRQSTEVKALLSAPGSQKIHWPRLSPLHSLLTARFTHCSQTQTPPSYVP